MKNFNNAFTMIELIFVIVILGILAAVAIPRLAATRDDAKISVAASDLSNIISDFGSYYTSKDTFATIENMTNVKFIEPSNTDLSGGASVTYEVVVGAGVCLTFTTTSDGNLTVVHTGIDTGVVCTTLSSVKAELIKTHSFGGADVIY